MENYNKVLDLIGTYLCCDVDCNKCHSFIQRLQAQWLDWDRGGCGVEPQVGGGRRGIRYHGRVGCLHAGEVTIKQTQSVLPTPKVVAHFQGNF